MQFVPWFSFVNFLCFQQARSYLKRTLSGSVFQFLDFARAFFGSSSDFVFTVCERTIFLPFERGVVRQGVYSQLSLSFLIICLHASPHHLHWYIYRCLNNYVIFSRSLSLSLSVSLFNSMFILTVRYIKQSRINFLRSLPRLRLLSLDLSHLFFICSVRRQFFLPLSLNSHSFL